MKHIIQPYLGGREGFGTLELCGKGGAEALGTTSYAEGSVG